MADQFVFPAIDPTVLPVVGGGLYPVRRIYCVGRNYVSHIREMKEADERDPPFFFQKPRDAIADDGATVPYPPDTDDFQYEIELVAAIGKDGRDIDVANALNHVWGYAVGIELTRRDRQRDARDLRLASVVHLAIETAHKALAAAFGANCRKTDRGALVVGWQPPLEPEASSSISVRDTVPVHGPIGGHNAFGFCHAIVMIAAWLVVTLNRLQTQISESVSTVPSIVSLA